MRYVKLFEQFVNDRYNKYIQPLNESFKSSILQSIADSIKGRDASKDRRRFFDALSSFGVAASEVTDLHITKIPPSAATSRFSKKMPNAILIYYSTKDKPNPYAGKYSSDDIIKANKIVAVVKGGEFLGIHINRFGNREPSFSSGKDTITLGMDNSGGKFGGGLYNIKRVAKVSDIVYVIDKSNVPSSTDLKHLRNEQKSGASAFKNDKQFRIENTRRYEAILRERASNDNIDKVIKDAIDKLTDYIKNALSAKNYDNYGKLVVGEDKRGRTVTIDDTAYFMRQILDNYSYYVEYKNSAEKLKERDLDSIGDSFYDRQWKIYAKKVMDSYKKIDSFSYS